MRAADEDASKATSSQRQMKLLETFGLVEVAADREAASCGDSVVFSGHLMKAGDAAPEALAAAERWIAAEIGGWIAANRISSAHAALACGADIVFAEQALAAGIPLHVVLPFGIARFEELSVAVGNGPGIETDWVERYRKCLDLAASVAELWTHAVPQ